MVHAQNAGNIFYQLTRGFGLLLLTTASAFLAPLTLLMVANNRKEEKSSPLLVDVTSPTPAPFALMNPPTNHTTLVTPAAPVVTAAPAASRIRGGRSG